MSISGITVLLLRAFQTLKLYYISGIITKSISGILYFYSIFRISYYTILKSIPDILIPPFKSRTSRTPAAPLLRYSLFYSLFSSLKGFFTFYIVFQDTVCILCIRDGTCAERYKNPLRERIQRNPSGRTSGFLNFLKRRPSRICLQERS